VRKNRFLILPPLVLLFFFNTINAANSFQLDNGLTVILNQRKDIQALCIMTFHLLGTRDDPPNFSGISYLLKDLLFLSGGSNYAPLEPFLFIRKNSGQIGSMINYDYSYFFQLVPDNETDNALWFESERIKHINFSNQTLNIVKNNIYKRTYYLSNEHIESKAAAFVKENVFLDSAYRLPLYGNPENIRNIGLSDINKAYRQFVNLSNIILVIDGNFDEAKIRTNIDKNFKTAPSSQPTTRRKFINFKPLDTKITQNWLIPELKYHFIMIGIRGPAKFNLDYLHFSFIKNYLVNKHNSRLEWILNTKNNLNIEIDYEFTDYFEGNCLLIRFSSPIRANIEQARYFLNKEFESLRNKLLTGNEMRNTITIMEINFLKKLHDPVQHCKLLAENYYLTSSLNFKTPYINRLRKLTAYDIIRIAKKYLKNENIVNLNVYDK
jgi:predicted Zn-dependent peptidase